MLLYNMRPHSLGLDINVEIVMLLYNMRPHSLGLDINDMKYKGSKINNDPSNILDTRITIFHILGTKGLKLFCFN